MADTVPHQNMMRHFYFLYFYRLNLIQTMKSPLTKLNPSVGNLVGDSM